MIQYDIIWYDIYIHDTHLLTYDIPVLLGVMSFLENPSKMANLAPFLVVKSHQTTGNQRVWWLNHITTVFCSFFMLLFWLIHMFEWFDWLDFSVLLVKPWLNHQILWLNPSIGWLKDNPIPSFPVDLAVPGGACDSLQGRHLWSYLAEVEIGRLMISIWGFWKWEVPKTTGSKYKIPSGRCFQSLWKILVNGKDYPIYGK